MKKKVRPVATQTTLKELEAALGKEYRKLLAEYPGKSREEIMCILKDKHEEIMRYLKDKHHEIDLEVYRKFYLTGVYHSEAECIQAMQQISYMSNFEIIKHLSKWKREKIKNETA